MERRKGLSRTTWRLREERIIEFPFCSPRSLLRDAVLRTKRVARNRDGFHVWSYSLLYM